MLEIGSHFGFLKKKGAMMRALMKLGLLLVIVSLVSANTSEINHECHRYWIDGYDGTARSRF